MLQECFSPCTPTVNNGQTYQVAVADYAGVTFDHWSDGTASRVYTLTVGSASTTINLTAIYDPLTLSTDSRILQPRGKSAPNAFNRRTRQPEQREL